MDGLAAARARGRVGGPNLDFDLDKLNLPDRRNPRVMRRNLSRRTPTNCSHRRCGNPGFGRSWPGTSTPWGRSGRGSSRTAPVVP